MNVCALVAWGTHLQRNWGTHLQRNEQQETEPISRHQKVPHRNNI
jgi:hypothetical protein